MLSKVFLYGSAFLLGAILAVNRNPNAAFDKALQERKSKEKKVVIDSISVENEDPVFVAGKTLFKNNCATCHNRNMRDDMTGPALRGVTSRWSAFPPDDLYKFIRNSQKMIHQEKHPRALELWNKWAQRQMNTFEHLSDADIESILAYIEGA